MPGTINWHQKAKRENTTTDPIAGSGYVWRLVTAQSRCIDMAGNFHEHVPF